MDGMTGWDLWLGAGLLTVLVALAMLEVGRRLGVYDAHRERARHAAITEVMASTVARRDIDETLGWVLHRAAEGLGAVSGAVLLARSDGHPLDLVGTLGVARLDRLTRVPVDDPLVERLHAGGDDAVLLWVHRETPWLALAPDGRQAVWAAAARTGSDRRRGLLALAWRRRAEAEAALPALVAIGRHTGQVIADYESQEARSREFHAMSGALQRQEVLLRTAAHDMGNRLALLQGYLSAMSQGWEPADPARLGEMAYAAEVVGSQLEDLKNPEHPLNPERLCVSALVANATRLTGRMMKGAGATLEVDAPDGLPDVEGDWIGLLRVLDNLLRNAVKHNKGLRDLRVWLRVSPSDPGWVEFEVGDNGRGIPPDAQPKLFEFGFRANSVGDVQGHGYGLWSCRRLVALHGGRIRVESAPGAGTRFRFTVPVAAAPAVARRS